jgi:hypothetical protein
VCLAFQLMGAGTGLNMAPCTSAILSNVSAEKQGVGAAVNHTTRELGTALGVALLGGVLTAGYRSQINGTLHHLPRAAREAGHNSIAEALAVAAHLPHREAGHLVHSAQLAFVAGVHATAIVMAAVMAGTAVIALVWAPRHRRFAVPETLGTPVAPLKPPRVAPLSASPLPVSAVSAHPPEPLRIATVTTPAPAPVPEVSAPPKSGPSLPRLAAAFALGVLVAGAWPAVRRARSTARS